MINYDELYQLAETMTAFGKSVTPRKVVTPRETGYQWRIAQRRNRKARTHASNLVRLNGVTYRV